MVGKKIEKKIETYGYEGETSDGTVLYSCPDCFCVVTENNWARHTAWHVEMNQKLERMMG